MFRRNLIVVCVLALLIAGVWIYAHHVWSPLPAGTTIDRILVEKSTRRLLIFRDGKKLKSYRVALGHNPIGAKQEEGDMRTPKAFTRSTVAIHEVTIISRCTFRIRRKKTQRERQSAA